MTFRGMFWVLGLALLAVHAQASEPLRPVVRGELGKASAVQRENMRTMIDEIKSVYRRHAGRDAVVQSEHVGADGVSLWIVGGLPLDKRVVFWSEVRNAVLNTDVRRIHMVLAERLKEADLGGGNVRHDLDGIQVDVTEDLGVRQNAVPPPTTPPPSK